MAYAPAQNAAFTSALVLGDLDAAVSMGLVSALRDVPGQGDAPAHEVTDARADVDVAASDALFPGVRIAVRADNVLDQRAIVSRRPFGARPGQAAQRAPVDRARDACARRVTVATTSARLLTALHTRRSTHGAPQTSALHTRPTSGEERMRRIPARPIRDVPRGTAWHAAWTVVRIMNHPRSLFLAFTTALVLGATSSGCAFVPVRAAVPLAKDAPTSVQATGTAGLTYVPNLVFGGAVAQPTLEAAVAATHRFDAGDVAVEPTLEAGIVGLVDDKGRAVPAALATGAGTRMWLSPDAPLTLGAEAHATAFAGVDKPVLLGAMLEMRGLVAWRVAPPLALYARPGVVMSVLPLPAPILELPVGATVDLGPVRLGAEAAFGHGLLLMYAPSLRAGVSAAFAF